MATWLLYGQDRAAGQVAIDATDKLGFFGTDWDDGITVNEYQVSTHVETSVPADKCTGDHLHNTQYSSDTTHVRIDGGGEVLLTTVTDAQAPLKINFAHSPDIETLDAEFFFYDGTTEATGPVDITVQAAEAGTAPWVNADGSGSPLTNIADNATAAASHDFFFALSALPEVAGELDEFSFKFSLYYQ